MGVINRGLGVRYPLTLYILLHHMLVELKNSESKIIVRGPKDSNHFTDGDAMPCLETPQTQLDLYVGALR